MEEKSANISNKLTGREKQLIKFLRELGWGDVKIRVENGQPVMIYEAVKTFRLEEQPSLPKKLTKP